MLRGNGRQKLWRLLTTALLSASAFTGAMHAPVTHAAPITSANVAYVTDFGSGLSDTTSPSPGPPGSSIFVNALTGSPLVSGGSYNGATFTDVSLSALDAGGAAALAGFDTVILYEVCSIGDPANTNAMNAIDTFLAAGNHKVMVFDADGCATISSLGKQAVYNGSSGGGTFLFPFATNSPGPLGAGGAYSFVETLPSPPNPPGTPTSLTTGLAGYADTSGEDALGDANVFTSHAGAWCDSLSATNANTVNGFVEAYARTLNGSLAIYEGEDFWFTFGPTPHLKQVFDNMLAQPFGLNPDGTPADGLPCTNPASGIKLDPATSTNLIGTPHTDTATVVGSDGTPLAGVTVTFTVVSGPDTGLSSTAVTDSNGHATFTFTDTTAAGTDVVVATFTDSSGILESSNQADKTWNKIPTTLSVANGSGDFNDLDTLSATLTDNIGNPIPNATINLSLNSTETCSGVTNNAGTASCQVTPSEAAGSYPVMANYAGDATHLSSTGTGTFTVNLEEAALASTTSLQLFAENGTATLSSVLTDPVDGIGIAGKPVTMTLGSGASAQSCTGTTDGSGTATCSIIGVTVPLGPQPVTDSFAGDAFYLPATPFAQSALVFANLAQGAFVLGDKTVAGATSSTTVTWWSSQWTSSNSLSGGTAPAAFKGFAKNTTEPPACGNSWTTSTGNSPPPPGSVPSYMATIVSSKVTQSGSTISGNIPEIVIVKTNPGYANPASLGDPGHPGTGTVVAVLCHS